MKFTLLNCPVQKVMDEESFMANRVICKSNFLSDILNIAAESRISADEMSVIIRTKDQLTFMSVEKLYSKLEYPKG